MKRNLKNLANQRFDVLVVGGGIHGAITAWDAALRGVTVGLIERGDFGGGVLETLFQQNTDGDAEPQKMDTDLFDNALNLHNTKVRQCLVPRKEIVGLEVRSSIEQVREKFIDTKLSKLIVYESGQQNVQQQAGNIAVQANEIPQRCGHNTEKKNKRNQEECKPYKRGAQEQLRIFNIAGKNDPALPALFFLQLYAKAVGTVKGHFDPREKTHHQDRD